MDALLAKGAVQFPTVATCAVAANGAAAPLRQRGHPKKKHCRSRVKIHPAEYRSNRPGWSRGLRPL